MHTPADKAAALEEFIVKLCDDTPVSAASSHGAFLIRSSRSVAVWAAHYGNTAEVIQAAREGELPVDQIRAAIALIYGEYPRHFHG